MLAFYSTPEISEFLISPQICFIPHSVFLPGKNLISYIFVQYTPMDLLWKEQDRKHDNGTCRNSGQSLYWGTDHQCNTWIISFRKQQKCSLLCILLWSHWIWYVVTGHHAQCCWCLLPFQARRPPAVPGFHAHSTSPTDCMELAGHLGWCNASSKCETHRRYHTVLTHTGFKSKLKNMEVTCS